MSTSNASVNGPDLLAVLDGAARIVARAQFAAEYTRERVRDRFGTKGNPYRLHAFRSRNDLDEGLAWVGWVLGPPDYDWKVSSGTSNFRLAPVTHFFQVSLLRDAVREGEEPQVLWGTLGNWRTSKKIQRKAFEFARDMLSRINDTRADGEVADAFSQATVSIGGRRRLAEFLSDEPVGALADDVLQTIDTTRRSARA
jgi:hypothetical protein